jgi:hypothetical protein
MFRVVGEMKRFRMISMLRTYGIAIWKLNELEVLTQITTANNTKNYLQLSTKPLSKAPAILSVYLSSYSHTITNFMC